MNKKIKKINEGFEDFIPDDYDPRKAKTLTREEEAALGIPSPADLAKMLRTQNINLTISDQVIDFFKAAAKKEHVPYQRLIRAALDFYVDNAERLPKISPA